MRLAPQSRVRLKVGLTVVLFLHVMVHPMEHGLPLVPPATAQCSPASSSVDDTARLQSSDVCLTCRNASSLIATPLPAVALGVPAAWESLTPAVGIHFSQPFFPSPSVRAPPLT
jgi:hypothetical protein